MVSTRGLLTGAILGAGAMYFFDPRLGNRRRTLVEDRLRRLSRRAADEVDAGLRDLENRGRGVMHGVGSLLELSGPGRNRRRTPGSRSAVGPSLKWAPGPRLLAATCGTALMANCLVRRSPSAILLGTLGCGLLTRALSGTHGGIEVQKTIEIAAPVDRVFEFFSHPENYLRVSDVITHVEILADGRFAKDMSIAGVPIHFEERFVRSEPDHLIETQSEPRSAIAYCKQLRFEQMAGSRTRLHVRFNYHPLGGVFGHAAAIMLGIDPKALLGDLLMRVKFFLETGREPHDAVAFRRRTAGHATPTAASRDSSGGLAGSSTLHGPAAPTDDVLRPGIRETGHPSTWPTSSNWLPQPAEATGRFPPAV